VAEESLDIGNDVVVDAEKPDPAADAKLESLLNEEMLMLASGILFITPPSLISTSSTSALDVVCEGSSAVAKVSTVEPFTNSFASAMLMPVESDDISVLTSMVFTLSVPEMLSESLSWMAVESSDSMMLTLSVSVAHDVAADCPLMANARLDSAMVLSWITEPVILPIAMCITRVSVFIATHHCIYKLLCG
jgi:hypothetical protein